MDIRNPSVLHQSPSIASARLMSVCSSMAAATRISNRPDITPSLQGKDHVPAFSDRQAKAA
jgi:hypothetical protein